MRFVKTPVTVMRPVKFLSDFSIRWLCRSYCATSNFGDETTRKTTPARPNKESQSIKTPWKILKNESGPAFRDGNCENESEINCDVAVIGGGVMGCSTAYWLKHSASRNLNVVVIEKDPTYSRASTPLSVGGVRQQFSNAENIQLSLSSVDFIRNVSSHLSCTDGGITDVGFEPRGYLCLASEKGAEQMKENYKLQKELGANLKLLTPSQLEDTFSWLNTTGVELGCYGVENEGWFDPWCLLKAFKDTAASYGTKFLNAEVVEFEYKTNQKFRTGDTDESEDPSQLIDAVVVKLNNGGHKRIKFSIGVMAAGASSGEVGKLANIGTGPGILQHAIPVEPRKRYVYVFHCVNGPGLDCPLLIDPIGTYFRREGTGGNYIGGQSPLPSEEPSTENLEVDYSFFDSQVWPVLAQRVPAFEAIKLKGGWAGYYDYNTFDQNGIIGPHPYYRNLILATGFSGHGIQQSPAVGRAVMELIIHGKFQSIDLSRFGFERVINNNPVFEKNIF